MPSYNDFKRAWTVKQLGAGGSNPFNLAIGDVLRFEGDGTTSNPGELKKNSETDPIGTNCVYVATNTVDFDHNITGGLSYRVTLTVGSPKPPNKDSLNCRKHPSGNSAWTTQEGG